MLPRPSVAIALLAALLCLGPAADATAKKKHHNRAKKGAGLLASDTGSSLSPLPFWDEIECVNDARHQLIPVGGDPHPTATTGPQGNTSFRRLSVLDGDDFYGERCELGNDNRHAATAFYREGQHKITQISFRLPSPGFPLGAYTWQAVMQMKQAGPANNSGGAPVLEFDAWDGRWRLRQSLTRTTGTDLRELWSAPATPNLWTRFSFDVRYSGKPKKGFIQISADLNGDNDYTDAGELSPRIRTYTLKVETPGGGRDGIPPGRSLTSHLRAGIYHDSAVSCPGPLGCYVDIDNVQILRP